MQDKALAELVVLAKERVQDAKPVTSIVADTLRQAVISGLLQSGQVLRQDELAETFGVSRMPVREALRHLESEGLVKHFPRRGFVVATHTAREVAGIYEIRVLLEGYAMRLAVPRLDEKRLRRLEKLQAFMHTQADPLQLAKARDTFYRTLYEAAERPRLVHVIMQLRAEVARYLLTRPTPVSRESHAELLTLCRRRDGRAAEKFIREHLRRVAARLQELMGNERRGGDGRSQPPRSLL